MITTFGAQPSGSGAPTPDGKPDRPFVVVAEFGLILTTVVPASRVVTVSPSGITLDIHNPSRTLGVAPMDSGSMTPQVTLSWIEDGGAALDIPFVVTARPFGSFPVGVWGPPQDADNRPMPKGDVIEALCELDLSATARIGAGTPPIPYYQVEINDRRPLPFTRSDDDLSLVRTAGTRLTALLTAPADVDAAFAAAGQFLSLTASPTALAALRGERQAPPMVGTLGEGLDALTNTVIPTIGDGSIGAGGRHVRLPGAGGRSLAVERCGLVGRRLAGGRPHSHHGEGIRRDCGAPRRRRSREVEADRSVSIAAGLVIVEPPATVAMRTGRSGTLIATGDIPPSETGRAAPALVASRAARRQRDLRAFSDGLRARRRVTVGRRAPCSAPAMWSCSPCPTPAATSTRPPNARCSECAATGRASSPSPTADGCSTTSG